MEENLDNQSGLKNEKNDAVQNELWLCVLPCKDALRNVCV